MSDNKDEITFEAPEISMASEYESYYMSSVNMYIKPGFGC